MKKVRVIFNKYIENENEIDIWDLKAETFEDNPRGIPRQSIRLSSLLMPKIPPSNTLFEEMLIEEYK